MTIATIANSRNPSADSYVLAATLPPPTSAPNLRAEAAAICELSRAIAEDPAAAVRYLLDFAQHLCGADSAGLSLVRHDPSGDSIIRWEVVSGVLADHEATEMPRDASPCGLCLDIGVAILLSQPERSFERLAQRSPAIAEILTIPLHDSERKPLGTLWVALHDSNAHFHSDHERIVTQLAAQLVLALKLQEQASEHRRALAVYESHQWAQHNLLAYDLYEERGLREQAEIENRQALRFKDALIDEVNHRTKNTLQVAANLLAMQARASSSLQVREALEDNAARLQVLAKVHELLYAKPGGAQSVLMPQLLQALGQAFRQSFGRAWPQVILEIVCDPMELPTPDAVALGLLMNEAITNAYKHAFANESGGMITVGLQHTPAGAICLRIEDTGSGFAPPDGGKGMGLTLIRTFATQLGGALGIAGRGPSMGTSVTLTIDPPANKVPALA
jgi:two-component sensor histidine kinase